jgi:hypothetical protein
MEELDRGYVLGIRTWFDDLLMARIISALLLMSKERNPFSKLRRLGKSATWADIDPCLEWGNERRMYPEGMSVKDIADLPAIMRAVRPTIALELYMQIVAIWSIKYNASENMAVIRAGFPLAVMRLYCLNGFQAGLVMGTLMARRIAVLDDSKWPVGHDVDFWTEFSTRSFKVRMALAAYAIHRSHAPFEDASDRRPTTTDDDGIVHFCMKQAEYWSSVVGPARPKRILSARDAVHLWLIPIMRMLLSNFDHAYEKTEFCVTPPLFPQLPEDESCPICLQASPGPGFKLFCGHMMHEECLRIWHAKQPTCPVCRDRVRLE